MRRSLAVLVVLLCGCPHYAKLESKNVTALEAGAEEDSSAKRICARGGLVEVIATTKDGKKLAEGGSGIKDEKHFDPELVKLTASIGTVHERLWNPPDEAVAMLGKKVTFTATLIKNPSITSTVELEPHWACEPPVALIGGGDGGYGGDGKPGVQAAGEPGGNGGAGGSAPSSTVAIGYVPNGDGKLVLVDIVTTGVGEFIYLLDPSITMRVSAAGGAGGAGGIGGDSWGAMNPGEGTFDGARGGDGGDGGDGGNIVVQYDAASPELLKYVNVDASAGPGGDLGPGGAGGHNAVANPSRDAQRGADGRPGRAGRQGSVQTMPMTGMSSSMTAYVGGGKKPEVSEPPAGKKVATTKGGHKKGGKNQVEPPEPPKASGPPGKKYSTDDGARVYVGEATLDVVVPKEPKGHKRMRTELISTRTRRHHFTIAMGEDKKCVLAFTRVEGDKHHIYNLDAPTPCPTSGADMSFKRGKLTLDTANDTLTLSLGGVLPIACKKKGCSPVNADLSFAIEAKRR